MAAVIHHQPGRTVVMVVRVEDFAATTRDSLRVSCSRCGHPCWLSPGTDMLAACQGWPICCAQCVPAFFRET